MVFFVCWPLQQAAANDTIITPAPEIETSYRLGSGDLIKMRVFGEEALSGDFEVDGNGRVALPLIGSVQALDLTTSELEKRIAEAYSEGYLRNPRINIEVLNYRPFYIIGEVNKPGSYAFVSGMNVINAVAMAGGFTYRAQERAVELTRIVKGEKVTSRIPPNTLLMPGDIIRVEERFF
jgi:polysaccharide export outer membrane protein